MKSTSKQPKTDLSRLAKAAVLASLALVLSYVDSLIPLPFPVPGLKLGLANLAILFALYQFGPKTALVVNLVRILLSAALFGSPISLLYSLAGGLLSLALMILLKKWGVFSIPAVSMASGVFHNVGQLLVAALFTRTAGILSLLSALGLTGMATGLLIGLIAVTLLKRLAITERF